jgi:hypothetical protein
MQFVTCLYAFLGAFATSQRAYQVFSICVMTWEPVDGFFMKFDIGDF